MEFHGMLLWNDKSMSATERLDIQERITIVRKQGNITNLFAVSIILKDGISPLMIRQKMQADMMLELIRCSGAGL